MKQESRYLRIRLILGLVTLLVGLSAANLALFNWVERTDLYYLLGDYARYVCAYGGFAAMIFGAMLINDFLVHRRTLEPGKVAEKETMEKRKDGSIDRKIATISLAFFCIFLSFQPLIYSLVNYTATVVITPKAKWSAFAYYRSNTGSNFLASCKERKWNGSLWSSEDEMPTAGSPIRFVRAVISTNSERIVATLSDDGYIDVYVWNGTSWKVTNNIGQVNSAADLYQSFDIAYEGASGNAILVYAVLSTDSTRDLAYRIWNGTNWLDEAYIDDAGQTNDVNYRWVELESNPTSGSNEIALIAMDQTDADCNGWIWNGSVWGNFQELENNLAGVRDNKLMAVAYEQDSGEAMFVWGYNNYMESRKWNGTDWENELPAIDISTLNVRWISLKADPTSNRLMAVTIDGQSDLNSVYWNGSAWGSPIEHDDGITHIDKRCADFDWEPSGGRGLLVWSTAQDSISYKTFTAPSTWGNTSTVSNPGGHPWIQLRRNPRNVNGDVKILGATLNSNYDIFGFRWNGSALTFEATAFTLDTTMVAYECFDVIFSNPS